MTAEPDPDHVADAVQALALAPLHRFEDWKPDLVPNNVVGVYTIWDRAGRFIYVGVAGRGLDPTVDPGRKRKGLRDRLHHHSRGRRSGDQFCVYVFDRLVLPSLSAGDVQTAAAGGDPSFLDRRVREYIRENLCFRWASSRTFTEALAVETYIKSVGIDGQQPLLNPLGVPDD